MIGRGVLADPFLPREIRGEHFTSSERIEKIQSFHSELYSLYEEEMSGPKHLCDKMKGFWEYLAVHIDRDGTLLKKIRKSKTIQAYDKAVGDFFGSEILWKGKSDEILHVRQMLRPPSATLQS